MSIFLTRLALEILLAVAGVDTPLDAEVMVSVISIQLMEQV